MCTAIVLLIKPLFSDVAVTAVAVAVAVVVFLNSLITNSVQWNPDIMSLDYNDIPSITMNI